MATVAGDRLLCSRCQSELARVAENGRVTFAAGWREAKDFVTRLRPHARRGSIRRGERPIVVYEGRVECPKCRTMQWIYPPRTWTPEDLAAAEAAFEAWEREG